MNNKSIGGFSRWLFWTAVYSVRPRGNDFGKCMKRSRRTRWPWWKFKPSAWHNEHGRMWQICLFNESSYTATRTIRVPVHISQETGKIIGLDLTDYILDEAGNPEEGITNADATTR